MIDFRKGFQSNQSYTNVQNLIVYFVSVLFVLYLFGKNVFAQFWLIDDHSIITFIGDGGKTILNFFDMLATTEVWQFGTSNRYRPGYYTWYILESITWGFHPMAWYISRLFMASVFIYSMIYTLRHFVGVVAAILFTAYLFTFSFWNDIWSRLGTGEVYAACGLGAFIIAFINLRTQILSGNRKWFHLHLALLSFGVFTAAGSKENFVLLALPLLYLLVIGFQKNKKIFNVFTAVIFANLLFISWIVLAIVLALAKSKVDFYVNPVTVSSRSMLLIKLFKIKFIQGTLLLSSISFLLSFYLSKKTKWTELSVMLKKLAFVYATCFFLYLTQYIFYNGNWPTGMRYDFPGFLCSPLFYLSSFVFLTNLCIQKFSFLNGKKAYFNFILSVILTGIVLKVGFVAIRNGAENNLSRTTETYNNLKKVAELVRGTSDAIVLESHLPINYESYFSIKSFMRYYYKIDNPIYLRVHGYSVETESDPLMKNLAIALVGIAEQDKAAVDSLINNCVSINLSGDTQTNCQPGVRFW